MRTTSPAAAILRAKSEALRDTIERAPELSVALHALRRDTELPQTSIATACGVSTRTVRGWEQGSPMRAGHLDRVRTLLEIAVELLGVLSPRGTGQWLQASNPLLGGARPYESLVDDPAAVVAAARAFTDGPRG